MRCFIGFDPRQPVAFQVLCHSIWKRATKPVEITRLQLNQLPIKRKGLTEFTFSRYLVPYLSGYKGISVFLDADMLCLADIHELEKEIDMSNCVSVVKGPQRFEWPSMMVFNCGHFYNRKLTPELIEKGQPHLLTWADDRIGELSKEWNHIVPYHGVNPNAKIVHFTQGIPCWPETRNCEFSPQWQKEAFETMSSVTFKELMGTSVHVQHMKTA